MTQSALNNPRHLLGIRSSTQDFLFCKTDSVMRDKVCSPSAGVLSPALQREDFAELLKEFPKILTGKSFIRAAMTWLDDVSEFGALAIRIDSFSRLAPGTKPDRKGNVFSKQYAARLLADVAKSVDSVCNSDHGSRGMWGLVERGIFGCFFPEKDEASCMEFAEAISKNLEAYPKETLSAGIACYPVFHFRKERIFENALKALEHASFLGPGNIVAFDAVSLNISGDKLYQKGNIHGAMEEFKTAILLDPSNVNVHNSLGVCYGVLGAFEKALEEFELAIRLNPRETTALYNAGLINMFTGNKNKALAYFLKALRVGEDVFEVVFQTGRLYLQMKKFKEAKKFFEKAVRMRSESGPAFRYLGECYAAMNMTGEAIRAYKKAIKQNPYDAASLSAIGYLFDVQGENPEIATVFCRHSVEIAPENGLFRHRLGMLYLKQNQLDDALKEFIKAMERGYDDSLQFVEDIHNRLTAEAS
ncbi:tetratricopeptide repeat protein [Desulfonema magnum]|uniref:Tetratricopeptide repeat-containing protein n=1 Tax=Desulfonema magnum TaxID=45655 RepID=A0A975GSA7_9BACT|nr:tetratricopeptide repeat protein [Desulfonema magnum]QTA91860.1 Tetratricopeptide repeat-containing protein [Desulfonema magnum]